MSFEPLVSIIIPVYNGSNYLREAIDSALAQTYPHTEVLVVNDGSRDEGATDAIAKSFGDRIRYFAKENGGVATALNLGIREMKGEYASWLSHDDLYYPQKVARQVEVLAGRNADARNVVLFSDVDVVNSQGQQIGTLEFGPVDPEDVVVQLVEQYLVNGCSTLIPRSAFDDVGFFDESRPTTQDYHMWMQLARRLPFVHMPQALIASRTHAEQGIATDTSHASECEEFYTWAVDSLSEEELRVGGRSVASGYYEVGHALCWNKRALQASRRALCLSMRHLNQEPLLRKIPLFLKAAGLYCISFGIQIATVMVRRLRRLVRLGR